MGPETTRALPPTFRKVGRRQRGEASSTLPGRAGELGEGQNAAPGYDPRNEAPVAKVRPPALERTQRQSNRSIGFLVLDPGIIEARGAERYALLGGAGAGQVVACDRCAQDNPPTNLSARTGKLPKAS